MNNYPIEFRVSGIDRQLEECKKHFERSMHIQILRTITESNEICLTVKKDSSKKYI